MLSTQTESILADEIVASTQVKPTETASEHPSEANTLPSVSSDTAAALLSELPYKEGYTIDAEGRFVGVDGFEVPRNFAEFYEEFPNHVRNFVDRHMMQYSWADREDRTSDLLLFLMTLPERSKFREPGFNGFTNGCEDRIQTFHPDRSYGASKPRFLAFVNLMLLNQFISLMKKRNSNPIERNNNLCYFDADVERETPAVIDDEYLHQLLSNSDILTTQAVRLIEDGVVMSEIEDFIRSYNPELICVFNAIAIAESFIEAQKMLGMNEQLFTRARHRLERLMKAYTTRTAPPRQRKLYRPRAKKAGKIGLEAVQ
jgi:hypothetical protein